jgi:hypothetical protein
MKQQVCLQPRSSEVRDKFDLSTSEIFIVPSLSISVAVLSENEMKQQACYLLDRANLEMCLI